VNVVTLEASGATFKSVIETFLNFSFLLDIVFCPFIISSGELSKLVRTDLS
jgi:hypothetical protein